MKTFWCGWLTGGYADEGCTEPPFHYVATKEVERESVCLTQKDADILNCMIDANHRGMYLTTLLRSDLELTAFVKEESEEAATSLIMKHFPDANIVFCVAQQENVC
jgi:hypothetical protein